jgi:sulfide:quinone oxidoreductase
MDIHRITPGLSVAPQISPADVGLAASQGFRSIVNNRPAGESEDQPSAEAIREAAQAHGLDYRDIPVVSGQVTDADAAAFSQALGEMKGPVLAFCRTGTRSATLWALASAPLLSVEAILDATKAAGYDLSALRGRLEKLEGAVAPAAGSFQPQVAHEVVIVGGGAGGIAAAASLLKRQPDLDIAIVEPRAQHYYQPGWTLVGGGVFERADTMKPMADVMPKGVKWVRAAVAAFDPARSEVVLEDGERLGYRALICAPGLQLDWHKIDGLSQTLGKNGVTSNYRFDMAPYTWQLVQSLDRGKAIFTQPPMPIKCAGAPQKAMYLSADAWSRAGKLGEMEIEFCNAGAALFGVKDYVPALMNYIERYGVQLSFQHNLTAVDGASKTATFAVTGPDGETSTVEKRFDMLHVCPPQSAPEFIKTSPLANAAGWVEVSPETLQHPRFGDVFALGDACSAPNAKTAAAVRKQAPVVATNVLAALKGEAPRAVYDGYGSCPLTVERGRIVLAEFGYGGKLLPSFPRWLVDSRQPSRLAWFLKEKMLPPLYWYGMFKGREWLAAPEMLPMTPADHEAPEACDFGPTQPQR